MDTETEQKAQENLEEALSDTDDPNISEEESINNYNKANDPKFYDKAKMKLHLIAMDAN
jgi:hypothetical protein